ncbi:MAG: hypothetical protein AAFY74_20360 [Pseudomonadota bacterium]
MALLYTDRLTALARAVERASADQTQEAYLLELLDMSAALDSQSEAACYRPFYAAARWIRQNRDDQTLKEADGAKFTGLADVIEDLLLQQRALDAQSVAAGLTIPEGFAADAAQLCSPCAESGGVASPLQFIGSVSVSTTTRF